MKENSDIIAGLDIGTTKICAMVGEVSGREINIIGIGTHPSVGLRKGVVYNMEATVDSIRKAVEEAELMAGCTIKHVYTGIAGGHITGHNSHGTIAIKGPEVSLMDMDRAIEAARAVAIPADREIIHVLPQEFIVDDHFGIHNPIGMAGVRLETKIHIVTGAIPSFNNIIKCCNKAGLETINIVLAPLASGDAVLSPEERELGTALIDFGGGTTDLAIFSGNTIRHTYVLPLGSSNLTNDIAIGLRAPLSDAERLKVQHGTCMADNVYPDEIIEVPSMGGRESRKLSRQLLADIIEARMEEIFVLLQKEIYRTGMESRISSGIVLTGGGALLEGIADLCESIFKLPVRVAYPSKIGGLRDMIQTPHYSTGVGLVLHGAMEDENIKHIKSNNRGFFAKLIVKIKEWFKEAV